jgi:hypothetical protein
MSPLSTAIVASPALVQVAIFTAVLVRARCLGLYRRRTSWGLRIGTA